MKKILFTLLTFTLVYACSEEKKEAVNYTVVKTEKNNVGLTIESVKDKGSDLIYWRTTWKEVEVFTKVDEKGLNITTNFKGHHLAIQLSKKDTAYQQPNIAWINDDLICVQTIVNDRIENNLFIPYQKETKDISFFNRQIVASNPEKSVVVYIDQLKGEEVTYAAYSAKTKNTVSIPVTFSSYLNSIPKGNKISFDGNSILIENDQKQPTKKDIHEIF